MRRNESRDYYLGRIDAVEDYVWNNPTPRVDVILSILNICGFPERKKEIEVVTFDNNANVENRKL